MATDIEIKAEMLNAVSEDVRDRVEIELNIYQSKDGLDGKSLLQKLYTQWKSGKKGNKNLHNSWAAFHLGLTECKPIGDFNIEMRRAFARPSPPDIDCDFEYERRDEIIQYLVDKYGRERVGNIGTYSGLKTRSALTRIIKALDIAGSFHKGQQEYTTRSVEKVTEILGSLPKQHGAVLKVKDETGEERVIKNTKDAYKYCTDFRFYMDKYPEIMQHSDNIEGLLSIYGCVAFDTPILTQKGWVRIDQLDRSCKISYLNSSGEQKFTKNYIAVKTGTKQCYRMRLENNQFVDLTDEHLVFTDSGCVEFKKIRENPKKYKVLSAAN